MAGADPCASASACVGWGTYINIMSVCDEKRTALFFLLGATRHRHTTQACSSAQLSAHLRRPCLLRRQPRQRPAGVRRHRAQPRNLLGLRV